MSIRLVMTFEDVSRENLVYAAVRLAAEAENRTGEAPWWRVEEVEQ